MPIARYPAPYGQLLARADALANVELDQLRSAFDVASATIDAEAAVAGAAGGSGHRQTKHTACVQELATRGLTLLDGVRNAHDSMNLPATDGYRQACKTWFDHRIVSESQRLDALEIQPREAYGDNWTVLKLHDAALAQMNHHHAEIDNYFERLQHNLVMRFTRWATRWGYRAWRLVAGQVG